MANSRIALLAAALALAAPSSLNTPAVAQETGGEQAPHPLGVVGYPAGSGSYPAVAEVRGDAPGYTIYRPADLPDSKLPLVLWGNGGCRDNGLSASYFLREIASHGYFVVANGAARQEPPLQEKLPQAPATDPITEGVEVRPPRETPDETSVGQLLAAIDWAKAADRNPDHKFYDRIDTSQIAAMGHSCGGLQALAAGLDRRITTVVALASGVYGVESSPPGNVEIIQADLAGLHTPVAFILGGPGDIAYPHGTRNFELINNVPVLSASLPVGHGGTFRLENGGEWARVATAWLDWQIKGSHDAARWFVGNDCLLCRDEDWEVRKKQFPEIP